MAKLKYDSVKVGDEIPKIEIKGVTRPDFVRYAGASGDFVPLHYDQTFVEAAGIPTVFAQGMFTAGLLSRPSPTTSESATCAASKSASPREYGRATS